MMFIKVPNAAGYDLQTSLYLVAIQVDEEPAMGQMVGRNSSEKMTIIVVFIISIDSPSVEPRKIIYYL